MSEPLPPGWIWATLEDVMVSMRNGISTKPVGVDGVPILRISAVRPNALDLTDVRYLDEEPAGELDNRLRAGDLLFTRYNGTRSLVGVCAHVPEGVGRVVYPDKLIRVRVNEAVAYPRYVQFASNSGVSRAFIESRARTTAGQTGVSGGDLRAMPLPLPPLAEQRRIVGALEEHLSSLDSAVSGLKRARANAFRYRDAVRAAAVMKFGAECLRSVGDCAASEPNAITDGPFGSKLKTEHYRDAGPRVIRLQNIGDGEFIDAQAHISAEHFDTLRKHRVHKGDIVIAALGETLPRACLIPDWIGPAIVKADCIRFRPDPDVMLPAFANIVLNSEPVRQSTKASVHGVGRPRLNLGEVKAIMIPAPPLEVQRECVAEVEERITLADRSIAGVDTQLVRASRLREAIFRTALSGGLVRQDPAETPASLVSEPIGTAFSSAPTSPPPARGRARAGRAGQRLG